jgi:dTMP kinase
MHKLKRGFLIALEGIDGAGKTTLANSIQSQCLKHNIQIIVTKEPGATDLGTQIRALLLDKSLKTASRAEFLLFAADRAQHIEQVIKPALANNMVVISDRMADSSVVYQGYGRGLDMTMIKNINSWAMDNLKPDVVFYVKISLPTAVERIHKRREALTTFEEQEIFTKKIIAGFDDLLTTRADVIVLDGEKSSDEVAAQAISHLMKLIDYE